MPGSRPCAGGRGGPVGAAARRRGDRAAGLGRAAPGYGKPGPGVFRCRRVERPAPGDLASAPGRCRGRAPPRRAGHGALVAGAIAGVYVCLAVVDHATFFRDPSATRKVAPPWPASSGPAWAMCCWCAWMTTSPSIAAPRRCCWDGTIARFSRRGPVMTPDPASRSSGSSTRRRPAPCTDDGLSHGQDPAHRRRPDAVRPDGGVSRAARFRPGAGQSRRSGRPGVSSALRRDRGAGRVAARPGWAESLPRSARPLGRADPDALRYPQRPGASPGPGRGRRRLCGEARVATCAAGADTRAVAPAQSVAAGAASAGIRRTGHRLRATPGLAARRRGGPDHDGIRGALGAGERSGQGAVPASADAAAARHQQFRPAQQHRRLGSGCAASWKRTGMPHPASRRSGARAICSCRRSKAAEPDVRPACPTPRPARDCGTGASATAARSGAASTVPARPGPAGGAAAD